MKLRDSPVCPYNATEFLEHFLLECPTYKNIREQASRNDLPYACLYAVWISQSCRPYKNYNFSLGTHVIILAKNGVMSSIG